MILSVLICTVESRNTMFNNLLIELKKQTDGKSIEIVYHLDNGEMIIGAKRNNLLQGAKGEYVCFIDDDDEIGSDYIKLIMDGLQHKPDCLSLRGIITWDGNTPELFEHSIKYKAYATTTNAIKYERYPNHLNVIKTSIAKQFKFPEVNHGEDTDFANQLFKSGLLKKEIYIDKILYHYKYIQNK